MAIILQLVRTLFLFLSRDNETPDKYRKLSAIQAGVHPLDAQRHSGHASLDMLKGYIRDATVFRGNPTAKSGR